MKNYKNLIIVAFFVMVLIQLIIPANIVYRGEKTLAYGKDYKFKTEPVDPNDPFRGKFISLRFKANHFKMEDSLCWEDHKEIFVSIENDINGYARISDISPSQPNNEIDYIKANVEYTEFDSSYTTVYIRYPFNRYYMEESKSAAAEDIYRKSLSDTTKVVYAIVTIKKGEAVLKDVMINNESLKNLIKKK